MTRPGRLYRYGLAALGGLDAGNYAAWGASVRGIESFGAFGVIVAVLFAAFVLAVLR